jgi:hypothetical protein
MKKTNLKLTILILGISFGWLLRGNIGRNDSYTRYISTLFILIASIALVLQKEK